MVEQNYQSMESVFQTEGWDQYKLVNILYVCNCVRVSVPKPKWKKVTDYIMSLLAGATPCNNGAVNHDSIYNKIDIKVKSRQTFSRNELLEFSFRVHLAFVHHLRLIPYDPRLGYSYNTVIEFTFYNGKEYIPIQILNVYSYDEEWHAYFYNNYIKELVKYDKKGRIIPLMSDQLTSGNFLRDSLLE